MNSIVYLDNAASTPVYPEVISTMVKAMQQDFANPSANHRLGRRLDDRIHQVRETILRALNAHRDYELVFTASSTEANNIVARMFSKGQKVLASYGDHSSLWRPIEALIPEEEESVCFWKQTPSLPKGAFDACFFSHVNSQTGGIAPYGKIVEIFKTAKSPCWIHLDATQSFSKIDLRLDGSNIDSVCIGAHKMCGPKGIGALIFRKNKKIKPWLMGGGQEKGIRSSTLNFPAVLGWEKSIMLSQRDLHRTTERIISYKNRILQSLRKLDPDLGVVFRGDSSPYILLLKTPGIPSDLILRHLEQKKIIVSSTTACTSKIVDNSAAFNALGISKLIHKNLLRVSFSAMTTSEEVDLFIEVMQEVYPLLKIIAESKK